MKPTYTSETEYIEKFNIMLQHELGKEKSDIAEFNIHNLQLINQRRQEFYFLIDVSKYLNINREEISNLWQ